MRHQAARRPSLPPRPPLTPPAPALHAPEVLSGTFRCSTESALTTAFSGHTDRQMSPRVMRTTQSTMLPIRTTKDGSGGPIMPQVNTGVHWLFLGHLAPFRGA